MEVTAFGTAFFIDTQRRATKRANERQQQQKNRKIENVFEMHTNVLGRSQAKRQRSPAAAAMLPFCLIVIFFLFLFRFSHCCRSVVLSLVTFSIAFVCFVNAEDGDKTRFTFIAQKTTSRERHYFAFDVVALEQKEI